ncbi:hypothetical protein [Variovorax sp. GB1P17]|uniref:hypothetical protein n=1 Tax=Variovorax sp. GB1P17 TaxID=3443740 RepID=UPI003F44A7D7
MNSDLDVDERRAVAQPRDWPEDFDKPTTWNVCGDCNRVFLGETKRIQCRVCAERRTV